MHTGIVYWYMALHMSLAVPYCDSVAADLADLDLVASS